MYSAGFEPTINNLEDCCSNRAELRIQVGALSYPYSYFFPVFIEETCLYQTKIVTTPVSNRTDSTALLPKKPKALHNV